MFLFNILMCQRFLTPSKIRQTTTPNIAIITNILWKIEKKLYIYISKYTSWKIYTYTVNPTLFRLWLWFFVERAPRVALPCCNPALLGAILLLRMPVFVCGAAMLTNAVAVRYTIFVNDFR